MHRTEERWLGSPFPLPERGALTPAFDSAGAIVTFRRMAEDQRHTILVVEDEPTLALGLCDALEFEGYNVLHAPNGQEGVNLATSKEVDVIVLDLMLPDINGYQVCETVRRTNPVIPILMLTARSQEADKIRGLDAGADDYVTKPFAVGELVARIRALLRRMERTQRPVVERIEIGDIVIDTTAQTLNQGSEITQLSFYEVELLKMLASHAGEPVSRDDILKKIWGLDAGPNNRTVDNFIVKLRRKIEPDPEKPSHILTAYGIGYKLVL